MPALPTCFACGVRFDRAKIDVDFDHTVSREAELKTVSDALSKLPGPILDPMERIAEILFGVIMALTFTCTLSVEIADDIKVRTMLIASLGCNLAWGIIDAGVYLDYADQQ